MSFLLHVIGNSIGRIPISVWKTSVVIGSDLKLGPTVAVTVLLLYKYVFHTHICTFAVVAVMSAMLDVL